MRCPTEIPLLLMASACSDGKAPSEHETDPSDSGGVTDSGSTATDDTGQEQVYLEPIALVVRGAFAYDPDLETTRTYYLDEHDAWAMPPWMELEITLRDPDTLEESKCFVSLQSTDEALSLADWASDAAPAALWFGAELGAPSVTDNCFDLDPQLWGDDIAATVEASSWGIGVGDLRSELTTGGKDCLEAAVIASSGTEEWEEHWSDYVFGGGVFSSAMDTDDVHPGGIDTWAYGFAYEVDDGFVMQFEDEPDTGHHDDEQQAGLRSGDHPIPIPRTEIEAASGLPRAVYTVSLWTPLNPADLLGPVD
jgi:hypothetical protein